MAHDVGNETFCYGCLKGVCYWVNQSYKLPATFQHFFGKILTNSKKPTNMATKRAKPPVDFKKVDTSIFGPPESAGVYAVCYRRTLQGREQIIYIGSAKNMKRRLLNPEHPYMVAFQRYTGEGGYVYTRCFECENFKELEIACIKHYNPKWNKQHKIITNG
jgi:hypothetical protein